jgi:hypothetical protein
MQQSTLPYGKTTYKSSSSRDENPPTKANSVIFSSNKTSNKAVSSYSSSSYSGSGSRSSSSSTPTELVDFNTSETGLQRVTKNKDAGILKHPVLVPTAPVKQELITVERAKKRRAQFSIDGDEDYGNDSDYDDFKDSPSSKLVYSKIPRRVSGYIKQSANVLQKTKQINPFKASPIPTQRPKLNDLIIDPYRQTTTIDDDSDFREKSQSLFIKPVIKKKTESTTASTTTTVEEEEQRHQTMKSLAAFQKQDRNDKDKKKCPYCSETLFPLFHAVKMALKEIERKDKEHEMRQNELLEKENSRSTSSYSKPMTLISKRHVPVEEKDAFCYLHNMETIIKPRGVDKGYPTTINFGEIHGRILKIDAELKSVIRKEITSDYRDIAEKAYEEQGVTKARSTMSVLNRFEASLPGYYGPKGSAAILSSLVKIYLKSGYMKKHLVSPQLPLEFLQQVLVPEAGFRLIRGDLVKKMKDVKKDMPNITDKAKTIMAESREYGSAIFPADEHDIEGYQGNIAPISFSEDEEDEEVHYISD